MNGKASFIYCYWPSKYVCLHLTPRPDVGLENMSEQIKINLWQSVLHLFSKCIIFFIRYFCHVSSVCLTEWTFVFIIFKKTDKENFRMKGCMRQTSLKTQLVVFIWISYKSEVMHTLDFYSICSLLYCTSPGFTVHTNNLKMYFVWCFDLKHIIYQ